MMRTAIARYEDLRQDVLDEAGGGGASLALFIGRGMVAWMKAWASYAPAKQGPPPEPVPQAPVSTDLRAQVTQLLVSMVIGRWAKGNP